MSIVLKDCYGKDQIFDHDKIFIRDENGELVQFTKGTGELTLQDKTITENGEYTADELYDGLRSVTVAVEGGSSADVRYVTFKSYDGLTEYGKKAVAVGDDCADPIARGIFGTPTRESDAQHNYTHSGWATEPNGVADSDWNKSITEDKTVYASYNSAVRHYTITYYDSDGSTVLKTESLAYGAMPSYVPTKDDATFDMWTPALSTVTGDASYSATWTDKPSFAGSTWAKIAEISESGEAADYFAVGDTRNIGFTASDGTDYTATLMIADFDHDPLASDTSVNAGMTIDCTVVPNETTAWASAESNTCTPNSNIWLLDDFLDTVMTQLPEELQAVIKQVAKKIRTSSSGANFGNKNFYLFPYTTVEVGAQTINGTNFGTLYPLFETESNRIAKNMATGEAVEYWLRSVVTEDSYYISPQYIKADGTYGKVTRTAITTTYKHVRFGFCI